jgi:hypothetical protein
MFERRNFPTKRHPGDKLHAIEFDTKNNDCIAAVGLAVGPPVPVAASGFGLLTISIGRGSGGVQPLSFRVTTALADDVNREDRCKTLRLKRL